jgi:hypothetical protein
MTGRRYGAQAVRAVRALCAGADGEITNASVNPICIHSAGGAASGQSVGRRAARDGRPPTAALRPCAKRDTPGYSRQSAGAEAGRANCSDGNSGARGQQVSRSRGGRWGEAAGERALGKGRLLILGRIRAAVHSCFHVCPATPNPGPPPFCSSYWTPPLAAPPMSFFFPTLVDPAWPLSSLALQRIMRPTSRARRARPVHRAGSRWPAS